MDSQVDRDPIWGEYCPCFAHPILALYQHFEHIYIRDEQSLKRQKMKESRTKDDDEALQFASDMGILCGRNNDDTKRQLLALMGDMRKWEHDSSHQENTPPQLQKARKQWLMKGGHTDKGGTHEALVVMTERERVFRVWLIAAPTRSAFDSSLYCSEWHNKGDTAMKSAINSLRLYGSQQTENHLQDAKRHIQASLSLFRAMYDFFFLVEKSVSLSKSVSIKIQKVEDLLVQCYPMQGCPNTG